jgi:uncharacterized membrane protein
MPRYTGDPLAPAVEDPEREGEDGVVHVPAEDEWDDEDDEDDDEVDLDDDWDEDDEWEDEIDLGHELGESGLMRVRWFRATVLVGIIAVIMSLFYPLVATRPRLDQRFEGNPGATNLNGYDWMRYGTLTNQRGETIIFSGDRDAIYWFLDEVEGTPVIMEAHIGPYRGNGSRFSINTGLPAVMGWANHETQQRYIPGIDERVQAVDEFYDTTDVQRKIEILDTYGVEYVIVGDVERLTTFDNGDYWADPAGIAAIESMEGTYLKKAFESGTTVVYRVVSGQ